MKKDVSKVKASKLKLHRETLRALNQSGLKEVVAGTASALAPCRPTHPVNGSGCV
jgi:hypothetical protein